MCGMLPVWQIQPTFFCGMLRLIFLLVVVYFFLSLLSVYCGYFVLLKFYVLIFNSVLQVKGVAGAHVAVVDGVLNICRKCCTIVV